MSSPPKRRRRAPRTMETQGAVRTTHQSLPELDAYPANNGSMASSAETNAQTCGDGNICGDAPKTRDGALNLELEKLPEDTIRHIHSLIPVQDAARVACVSRQFLRSWRCYSKLILTKKALGLSDDNSEGKFCLMSVPSFHLSLGMSRGLHCCPVNVNTPMLPHKLLHLKSLEIKLHRSGESPIYDIFSVVSFLDASPALESFILHAERDAIIHDCVAWDDLYPRGESAYKHNCLRRVKITGFHSAKSLIKFVIHILESAPSLESLMLDTTHGYGQKAGDASKCTASKRRGKCSFMSVRDIKDANSAVEAAGRYISGRVPSAVEYEVLEPCRRCHTGSQTVDEGWWACLKQRSG
ncbi:hypothetical protein ACQ4PT_058038 [Festuca glaucescens]